jgi:cytochrome c biogenesis factor
MSSHEILNSYMLYIHPPLAIIGYILIFLFTIFLFRSKGNEKKIIQNSGTAAWIFTFLGLLTGMFWAQIAWGNYWSWDPKETLTLALFIGFSFTEVAYVEKKTKLAKLLAILACVLTIITWSTSFIMTGLHSFA